MSHPRYLYSDMIYAFPRIGDECPNLASTAKLLAVGSCLWMYHVADQPTMPRLANVRTHADRYLRRYEIA